MALPNHGQNILPAGTNQFEFKGMKLHGYANEINDDYQFRIALHEFDRRPGGMTENMNLAPVQYRVTLVWITDPDLSLDGFADAMKFMQSISQDASGLLIHPIFGAKQMTCSGWQNASLRAAERNSYTMQVTFVDNTISQMDVSNQAQSIGSYLDNIAQKALQVENLSASLLDPYSTSTTSTALLNPY